MLISGLAVPPAVAKKKSPPTAAVQSKKASTLRSVPPLVAHNTGSPPSNPEVVANVVSYGYRPLPEIIVAVEHRSLTGGAAGKEMSTEPAPVVPGVNAPTWMRYVSPAFRPASAISLRAPHELSSFATQMAEQSDPSEICNCVS